MKYTKPAITLADQLQRLKDRGLDIRDDASAIQSLENIGYYRLSGYSFAFKNPPDRRTFKTGVSFDRIIRVYEFDRELRNLLMDAIDRIEISVRSRIVNATCQAWGSHWFMDAARFHRRFNHTQLLDTLERQLGITYDDVTLQRQLPASHPETFIEHYYTKYGDPYLPPFWMTGEVLTLGTLSRLYTGLDDASMKAALSAPFGVPAKVFGSWLHSLSHLRNTCAHHCRLWNRTFSISPKLAHKHQGIMNAPNRLEGHLVVVADALDVTFPGHSFRPRFRQLLASYPEIDPVALGFAAGWEALPFWNL